MKRIFPLLLGGLLLATPIQGQEKPLPSLYGTGVWNADSLGNHRVVVSVDQPSDAVLALIQWRRKDFNPENKDLIVIDAKTGKRITNVCRFQINREKR